MPTPSLTAVVDEGGGGEVRDNDEEDEAPAAAAADGDRSGLSGKMKKKNNKNKHRVLPQAMFKKLYQELLDFKLEQRLSNGGAALPGGQEEEGGEASVAVAPDCVASSGWGPLPKTEFVMGLLDLCRKSKEKLVRQCVIFPLHLLIFFSSD